MMRLLVLIAGAVVVLQASHVLSISIAFHAITQDFKNTRSIAGIAVGIGVSILSVIPARKNRVVERKNKIPVYRIDRARLWRNAQQLSLIADSMARYSGIR
jgi:NADH:ubiquinone oxidoreductase subunit 6 (subunit J)